MSRCDMASPRHGIAALLLLLLQCTSVHSLHVGATRLRAHSRPLISMSENDSVGRNNAMYDTLDVVERPDLLSSLEPRDAITLAFLGHGTLVSGLNVVGMYDGYESTALGVAAVLGLSSAAWGIWLLASGRVPDDDRPGFAHERAIMTYTSTYLAGVMWLCLRFSSLYPPSLVGLDPALGVASIASYVYGFYMPVRTTLVHWGELTPTEQLRMKGMVASGAIGAVFILNTMALLVNGPAWWTTTVEFYPAQNILEPSTALFAAYAVEAGMFLHRCARRGVLTFAQVVPFYGLVCLPVLTLLPMGCLFYWKQADISFWNFLFSVGYAD